MMSPTITTQLLMLKGLCVFAYAHNETPQDDVDDGSTLDSQGTSLTTLMAEFEVSLSGVRFVWFVQACCLLSTIGPFAIIPVSHGALSMLVYGVLLNATLGATPVVDIPVLFWWAGLCVAVTSLCVVAYNAPRSPASKDNRPNALWWSCFICCCTYLYRSVFMHCTVERDCFWDTKLCSPLLGRAVACVGEIGLSIVLMKVIRRPQKTFNIIISMVVLAELCSFIGVIKRHYLWFFLENSIWATCVGTMTASVWNDPTYRTPAYVGLLFVLYTLSEDLPMYYERFTSKTEEPGYHLGIVEGTLDALHCKTVSHDYDIWRPQMLWMTLNYTVAPVSSIVALYHLHRPGVFFKTDIKAD